MMPKPHLCVVPHNWAAVAPVLEPLVGPLFAGLTVGNDPAAFAAPRDRLAAEGGEAVLLVGGAGTHAVLEDAAGWRAAGGGRAVRWAHSYFTGLDAFDLPPIAGALAGVTLTNARGIFAPMLAEHVALAALYFNREVWRLQANRAARRWERFPSLEATRQTAGILGYGDIGKAAAAALVRGLGMKAVGWRTQAAPADELGVECLAGDAGLRQILATADFVVAVLPRLPSTTHLLRREHFRLMKPGAVFINVGRGATAVEADLAAAVEAGEIKGAAVDVFEAEPLPADSPLWALPDSKLLLSSHNADVSAASYLTAAEQFAQLARPYVEERRITGWVVDPARGY